MSYKPPVPTYKVGDIFTDELIAKINEILLDAKNTIGEKPIRSAFEIEIIDNQPDKIYKFIFRFDFRQSEDLPPKNIKQLAFFKSIEEYDRGFGNPTFIVPVDDNFQINADIEMIKKQEEPEQDDNQ